ncbi:phage holin family protein [Raoultella terrigena]|uniref:phage holin family protein n=1 Tax=Raoultella terrigena TaxID=577 RepID=UPI003F5D557B
MHEKESIAGMSWLVLLIIACWGGLVRYLIDVKQNKATWSLINALAQMVVSGFTTNLAPTKSVATGSALNMSVAVEGGTSPYTYVWKKDGTVVSGQTTATFNKASAVSGDAGVYTCEVTDSSATPVKITSVACTVTNS